MNGLTRSATMAVLAAMPLLGTGCLIQPWVADRMTEKYQNTNDYRTPILPPIRDGQPEPRCEDAPSDREILRILPHKIKGVPFVYEEFRDDVEITKNRIVDKIDPPRFFPLVGLAQLHHCHWECSVGYTETTQSTMPFPTYVRKRRTQVVYIDKDHLHLYVGPNADTQRETLLEMTKY